MVEAILFVFLVIGIFVLLSGLAGFVIMLCHKWRESQTKVGRHTPKHLP